MARHEEPLSGGLVTDRDPAFLEPGQLSGLQNAIYLPGSQALQRARGRSAFGTVSADAVDVDGLRDIQFDNGNHYLVAHATASYVTAAAGDTGTFGVLATGVGDGSQLEVVHYRNRFFLFNGATQSATATSFNRVLYLTATGVANTPTVRNHGLLPVDSAPTVTTAGGGTFSQSVTGYYEYWTTEVAKITQDGTELLLESAFSSDSGPTTTFVSVTSVVPTVQMPTVRNTELTTHWRIYRSPKKDKESDKKFPTGFMISELATGTSAQPDTSVVSTTSYAFPASFNSGAEVFSDAGTPSNLGADDAATASFAVGAIPIPNQQGCYGFNFGGFTGTVKGIEVEVQGHISAGSSPCPVTVTIGKRNPATGDFLGSYTGYVGNLVGTLFNIYRPVSKSGTITSTVAPGTTFVVGSATDRWNNSNGVSLADNDFSATRFMVVLRVNKLSTTVAIDYVKVRVSYASTFDSVLVYPSVVYTFGDVTTQVSKNHPPPQASTGDMFEDSLVVNDVTNPALIRYSYPGDPEAFPPTYFLDFETRENDRVTNIKVVNNRLVIFLETAVFRANYLPSERDASFDRGKAIEAISRTYGCVNEMCACVFSIEGGAETLAFVSDIGIHGTDGFSFDTYTDLDWRGVISSTSTSTPIALINDRERQELLFYYRNDSFTNETYKCLHLSYAKEHLVNGRLKVSGPVNVRNFHAASSGRADPKSAWAVRRTTGATDVFIGYGGASTAAGAGTVQRETGTDSPAQDTTMSYVTRRMYLAGMGNEWRLDDMYGYTGSYSGAPAISYTILGTKTDDAGETTRSAKSKTLGGQRLHHINLAQAVEGARVSAIVTASAYSQESLILDGANFGAQDSGR